MDSDHRRQEAEGAWGWRRCARVKYSTGVARVSGFLGDLRRAIELKSHVGETGMQHNPARNGKSRWITPAALTVRTRPRDSDVESPSRCYALTTRGCLSEERYQSTPATSNNAGTSPTR